MIIRTTKVETVTGNTIYESTCTIDGNTITGCQNPFPYIQRKLKKLHMHTVDMKKDGQNVTLIVR